MSQNRKTLSRFCSGKRQFLLPQLLQTHETVIDYIAQNCNYDMPSALKAVELGLQHFQRNSFPRCTTFLGIAYEIMRHLSEDDVYLPLVQNILLVRVVSLSISKQMSQALQEVEICLRVMPYAPSALYMRGFLMLKTHTKVEQAYSVFETLIRINPEWRNLVELTIAIFLHMHDFFDKAIVMCTRVIGRLKKDFGDVELSVGQPRPGDTAKNSGTMWNSLETREENIKRLKVSQLRILAYLIRGESYKFHKDGYFVKEASDDYTILLTISGTTCRSIIGKGFNVRTPEVVDQMLIQLGLWTAHYPISPATKYPMHRWRSKAILPFSVAGRIALFGIRLKRRMKKRKAKKQEAALELIAGDRRAEAERHRLKMANSIIGDTASGRSPSRNRDTGNHDGEINLEDPEAGMMWGPIDRRFIHVAPYRRSWTEVGSREGSTSPTKSGRSPKYPRGPYTSKSCGGGHSYPSLETLKLPANWQNTLERSRSPRGVVLPDIVRQRLGAGQALAGGSSGSTSRPIPGVTAPGSPSRQRGVPETGKNPEIYVPNMGKMKLASQDPKGLNPIKGSSTILKDSCLYGDTLNKGWASQLVQAASHTTVALKPDSVSKAVMLMLGIEKGVDTFSDPLTGDAVDSMDTRRTAKNPFMADMLEKIGKGDSPRKSGRNGSPDKAELMKDVLIDPSSAPKVNRPASGGGSKTRPGSGSRVRIPQAPVPGQKVLRPTDRGYFSPSTDNDIAKERTVGANVVQSAQEQGLQDTVKLKEVVGNDTLEAAKEFKKIADASEKGDSATRADPKGVHGTTKSAAPGDPAAVLAGLLNRTAHSTVAPVPSASAPAPAGASPSSQPAALQPPSLAEQYASLQGSGIAKKLFGLDFEAPGALDMEKALDAHKEPRITKPREDAVSYAMARAAFTKPVPRPTGEHWSEQDWTMRACEMADHYYQKEFAGADLKRSLVQPIAKKRKPAADANDHLRNHATWCGKDMVDCILNGQFEKVCGDYYMYLDRVHDITEMGVISEKSKEKANSNFVSEISQKAGPGQLFKMQHNKAQGISTQKGNNSLKDFQSPLDNVLAGVNTGGTSDVSPDVSPTVASSPPNKPDQPASAPSVGAVPSLTPKTLA